MKEFVTSLYSFDYVAKEIEPLSSSDKEDEINVFIQESQPNQKRRKSISEASASESDSEVDKEKKNIEDDHHDIVIEKLIYRLIMYN